ncbi:MAG: 30S ribosomal protein S6 [Patescibacteria group bacterium]
MDEKEIKAENMEDMDMDANPRIYEVGIHFVTSINEDGARAEFDAIREKITKAGGTLISEEAPVLFNLAYPMQRDIERKRYTFNTAYFGWMKFETIPAIAHDLKAFVAGKPTVLRSLLVKTTRESYVREVPKTEEMVSEAPIEEGAVASVPNVAVIDAEIEKLLA